MASNLALKMDSQDITASTTTDHREAGTITTDGNTPSRETKPTSLPSGGGVDKKKSAPMDRHKASDKCSKPRGRQSANKGKKGKRTPVTVANTSSEDDESEGSETSDDSDDSDDSESESDVNLRKKDALKRRHDPLKSRKKVKLTKKQEKGSKSRKHPETSDSEASGTDKTDHSDTDVAQKTSRRRGKSPQQEQLLHLQLQVLELQRQLAGLGPSRAGTGFGAQGLPANVYGALNTGTFGSSGGLGALGSSGGLATGGLPTGLEGLTIQSPVNSGRSGLLGTRIKKGPSPGLALELGRGLDLDSDAEDGHALDRDEPSKPKSRSRHKKTQRVGYKRVDQVWDSQIHNYKLQDTKSSTGDSQYDEYLFHVRRTFDWEGKYKATLIDIKSKKLREALQDVMGNIKGISLVEGTPKLDPNMLFLYLEEFREHIRSLKEIEPEGKTRKARRKVQRWIDEKRGQLKILVKYLDKDYAQVKKSLYPLLANGLITFELCWALWKPNTLAYTATYGSVDEPRVFKVEAAEKHFSIVRGEFYYVEGKYFEFDGKQFGYGSMAEEIGEFRGTRKITSLSCYPLEYHKTEAQLRKDLVERGKKFVSLAGVNYKSHHGLAYYKKKKAIIKVNINGRIMIDPSVHRRNNPNYPISLVRPKDHDVLSEDEDSDDEGGDGCDCESEEDGIEAHALETALALDEEEDEEEGVKYVTKVVKDDDGNLRAVRVLHEDELPQEKLDNLARKIDSAADKGEGRDGSGKDGSESAISNPELTDEEYLIASPVVLGFAFAEKLWLEFTVSGVKEISWNEDAYDSLVLEPKTKNIVKALVESHKYHAAQSVDDVIQGKGKGLVAVLHGPPGTGKTLTAEGISELLKCPLYMVSAGDLGTDSRYLEAELSKILEMCHVWRAILLLDEADVFLEKRNMHDIHRNALVSIFLRQLEYFQGMLFLTTNRVETFDDAFQSRIHIALRYDELEPKAKKAIFKNFIDRVRVLEKVDLMPFTDNDLTELSRHNLNGRQIKNTVRTAQALSINKGEPLSMKHIREVLDVQLSFERDLKGGPGFQDAMRSYF